MTYETRQEAFDAGYDRGNYGAAYESQDWETWIERQVEANRGHKFDDAYYAGMLLGFHSSLSLHEIGDGDLADAVDTARHEWQTDLD
jgi:hypothetical protein